MFVGKHKSVYSELVNEGVEGWDTFTETLSGSDLSDERVGLGSFLKRITVEHLPMREDALREGTAGGGSSESLGETKGLSDGEVSLDVNERSAWDRVFFVDDTSTLRHALVDTTDGIIRALDLDEEDRLHESWGSGELTGEEDTSGSGDDLTTTSVDSIGVESNILDVESDTSHVLISHDTLLGSPLEGSLDGVLDFLEVLNLFGDINDEVGASGIGTEAPDLLGIIRIPLIVILKHSGSFSQLLLGGNLVIFDGLRELITQWRSGTEDSVMLVGRLGEADLGGLLSDSLLVGNDWVTLLDWALSVLLFEILEADFDVELTATGNNVLTRLLSGANDERIRLGEFTETLDKLGEIGSVLDLDGDTHDRRYRVLHDLDAVSIFVIRDGTLLHEVLIDTDETDSVTARNIRDSLDLTSHHKNSSLDVLDVEVVSGSWLIVWSHDSDLLTSLDGTTEDTTESIESTLIVGGDHLGDEDHEGTVLVTVLDGLTARILNGTFVKHSSSVSLSSLGGGELEDDHLNESISSVDPFLENTLEEILHSKFLLIRLEDNVEGLKHLPDGVEVTVHNVSAELDDWSHNELDEASLEGLATSLGVSSELLGCRVEVVITPEFLHKSSTIELELLGIGGGESGKGEGPTEEGGTESNSTNGGVDLVALTHILELVGGDDDVGVLNNSLEVLVHGLTINLELEDTSVNLVDHHYGLNLLTESLSEDGLSLHTDTFDVIDDDKGTIGDTKGSSDFRGEINMAWGVNQVDKIRLELTLIDDISLVVKRDTSGLNCNATFLLVSTSVGSTGITSILAGNDTSFCNKGVCEGGLSVIDVSNDGHVTNTIRLVHDLSDLFNSEVRHVVLECLEI